MYPHKKNKKKTCVYLYKYHPHVGMCRTRIVVDLLCRTLSCTIYTFALSVMCTNLVSTFLKDLWYVYVLLFPERCTIHVSAIGMYVYINYVFLDADCTS